jgi:2-polyprenyl-6-hydroxyphenyl methylase/3-demethylubiquinone-9 3-methyltransferase
MSVAEPISENSTVDRAEVEKFERMAGEWWEADGKFRPLHQLNPVRLAYIRDHVAERFGRDVKAGRPFAGLRVLDIGCGGGLLSEPMARLGADVVGIDPSSVNIGVAHRHAEQSGLSIDYRDTTAEALAATDEHFDVVLAMEVIEHVPELHTFLTACAALLKPDGLLFLATINRTPKAFALAIVGAEYLLRWLPRGTHHYSQLVQPRELEEALGSAGLTVLDRCGVSYRALSDRWVRTADMDVNYMMVAGKQST